MEALEFRGDSRPSQAPKKRVRRTSMAKGRSVNEQCGFEVYKAAQNETHWLNEVVQRLWIYIEKSIQNLLHEDITTRIREEPLLKSFTFTECKFGEERPKFSQMKVRSKSVRKSEKSEKSEGNLLEVFMEIDWDAPESDISVSLGSMKLGMKHLQLSGCILLVLSPLLERLPLMGGLSLTFPDPPKLTWQWTGVAGMGITGIAGALEEVMALNIKEIIVHAIFETMVVPSRVFIDIADLAKSRHLPQDQRIENYRSPDPIGVLHVTLLGATALPAADFGFAGGSSDPYVVVKIGSKSWQSLRRMKTLNPKWGRAHAMDFLVYHMEQKLFVDVYDSDLLSKDDLLGYVCADGETSRAKDHGKEAPRRPRISDLDESQDEKEWELNEGGRLKMICRFREISDLLVAEPFFLNCNNRCHEGLQPTKNPRACHLCGEGSVLNMMRCGACFGDPGRYECPTCGFRCCGRCWAERRPASALLRVCLREGLVPLDDAKNGVVLGVSLEGETQWSPVSVRPSYEDMAEQSEVQRWIKSLCSRFDRASVAKWLEISPERIQEVLNETKDTTPTVDILGQEPVIWDHALHFLIREPHEDMCARLIYKGRSRYERDVRLLSDKIEFQVKGKMGKQGSHDRKDGPLRPGVPTSPTDEEDGKPIPTLRTWTIPLEPGSRASAFVEVTLQGLSL